MPFCPPAGEAIASLCGVEEKVRDDDVVQRALQYGSLESKDKTREDCAQGRAVVLSTGRTKRNDGMEVCGFNAYRPQTLLAGCCVQRVSRPPNYLELWPA